MTVYCASFQSSSDSWISGPGEWYGINAVSDGVSCSNTWLIVDKADFVALVNAASQGTTAPNPSNSNPFDLSISEGSQVAGAILATWAVAWAIKMIVRAIDQDGNSSES